MSDSPAIRHPVSATAVMVFSGIGVVLAVAGGWLFLIPSGLGADETEGMRVVPFLFAGLALGTCALASSGVALAVASRVSDPVARGWAYAASGLATAMCVATGVVVPVISRGDSLLLPWT